MREQNESGVRVDGAAIEAKLTELWSASGPTGHPYEAIYRRAAESMLGRSVEWQQQGLGQPPPPLTVALRNGVVAFTPDQVRQQEDGSKVFVWVRAGRVSSSELKKPKYGIYQKAAKDGRRVQVASLATGEQVPVELSAKQVQDKIEDFEAAVDGMVARRFDPAPDERDCPRCPHYFYCPAAEDGVSTTEPRGTPKK